ncbi:Hypothetical predicted protein [Pelobates cultripes]|uniref:Uncharacterized protein n=1 Tax=Pelobates cultripes TaxID=61616 RepID=A0AAD1RM84_PELCU|nr:Hypothetical predicted protein [Pelobates cultripes]
MCTIISIRICTNLTKTRGEYKKFYKTDLIRFKREKQEKVTSDYKEHRVYKWLSVRNDLPYFIKKRRPIRKPKQYTIDKTSGESTSESDYSQESHLTRQPGGASDSLQPFLETALPEEPGIRNRYQSRHGLSGGDTSRDVGRRVVPFGARGRPPRQQR